MQKNTQPLEIKMEGNVGMMGMTIDIKSCGNSAGLERRNKCKEGHLFSFSRDAVQKYQNTFLTILTFRTANVT